MFFPVAFGTNRKEQATARYLNRVLDTISFAPAHELRYVWGQLKSPTYVWRMAEYAVRQIRTRGNIGILRTTALFLTAGIRPPANELSPDVQTYLEQTAFLLSAHRLLIAKGLPTNSDRTLLFEDRKRAIIALLMEHDEFANSPFFADGCDCLCGADFIIYCADVERNFANATKLAKYLEQFCLLPEDMGITHEQLAFWIHASQVQQAQNMLSACRATYSSGEMQTPPIRQLYANIRGVLQPLAEGVTLDEIGMSVGELVIMKRRLEAWLPNATEDPQTNDLSPERLARFSQVVMPLFDQVLRQQTSRPLG